jgi:hypothetical protein
MTIEKELEKKGLQSRKRDALEKLKAKTVAGNLRDDELSAFRRRSAAQVGSYQALYRRLCALLSYAARQKDLPPGFLAWFDTGMRMLRNHQIEQVAGFEGLGALHRLLES